MNKVNIYYIVPVGLLKNPLWDDIVEKEGTVRKNIEGNKAVVKTPKGVTTTPASLANQPKFTHAEILIEMATPEWAYQGSIA